MISPLQFGYAMPNKPVHPNVQDFSEHSNGNNFLQLRQVPGNPAWIFAHRPNARGAVHALTVIPYLNPNNNKTEPHVVFELLERPPMGGRGSLGEKEVKPRRTLECPAGLVGDEDKNEAVLDAAIKEVQEETGYAHDEGTRHAELMADQWFATSPGMTTEHKAFVLVISRMTEPGPTKRSPEEEEMFKGLVHVPLKVFLNDDGFQDWIGRIAKQNITLGADVIAARGVINHNRLDALV